MRLSTTSSLVFLLLAGCALIPPPLPAQAAPAAAVTSATTVEDGPAGIIPYVAGFNLSLGTSSQHDSSSGWSSILNPNVAYRLNPHLSLDAGVPLFAAVNVLLTTGTKAKPIYTNATQHFVAGDAHLSGHVQWSLPLLDYEFTSTLGLPSGDSSKGLGAGQVTYTLNNHFEKSFNFFSPDLEIGLGDSSSLQELRVRKTFLTVGRLAHFQAGGSVDLPLRATFSANAYEELPVSSETVYTTTRRNKKKVTKATTFTAAEDNGVETSLDIPLQPHVTLSGFYNRSLRQRIDTVGFSLTFLLRALPSPISR